VAPSVRDGLPFAIQALGQTHHAAYQRWVRSGILAAGTAYFLVTVIDVFVRGFDPFSVAMQGTTVLLCGVAYWLAARDRPEKAAALAIAAVWLELHTALPEGGMVVSAVLVFPALTVATGLLLGGASGYAIAIVTSVTVPLTVALGGLLWAPQDRDPGQQIYLAVVLVAVMFVTAGLIDLAMRALGSVVRSSLANEERVRELVTHSPDGIMALSEEGTILSINPVAEWLLDSSAAELLGKRAEEVLRSRLSFDSGASGSLIDGGKPRSLKLATSGRIPLTVDVTSNAFTRNDGSGAVQVTMRDATERLRVTARDAELAARIEDSNRLEAVGRLAAGVAHDFNNHLTTIGAASELLLSETTGEGRDLARGILDAKMRASTLTRGLLAFARKQVISPILLCIDEVVRDGAPLFKSLLGDGVSLDLRIAATPHVMADRNQVEQCLVNLLANAKDAMKESGKVVISVSPPASSVMGAFSTTSVPEGFVELRVEDDGAGMDAMTLRQAFEPFFTSAPFGDRTGLGLAVVHGVVSQNGGSVGLESEVGRGTSVRIHWPVSGGA